MNSDEKAGYVLIYRKTIRLRNGKVIYAANYGLKAFRFYVKVK